MVERSSKWWNKAVENLKHSWWGLLSGPLAAYAATLPADLLRGGCLLIAVVIATVAFRRTIYHRMHPSHWYGACVLFVLIGIALFFGAHISDRLDKPSETQLLKTRGQSQNASASSGQQPAMSVQPKGERVSDKKSKNSGTPSQQSKSSVPKKESNNSVGSISQGPGSAISINQQGGITAGTVNMVPLQRHIKNIDLVVKALSQKPSSVQISCMLGDTETQQFADEWMAALRRAGWSVDPAQAVYLTTPIGVLKR